MSRIRAIGADLNQVYEARDVGHEVEGEVGLFGQDVEPVEVTAVEGDEQVHRADRGAGGDAGVEDVDDLLGHLVEVGGVVLAVGGAVADVEHAVFAPGEALRAGVGGGVAERAGALGRLGDDDDRQGVVHVHLVEPRDPLRGVDLAAAARAAGVGNGDLAEALDRLRRGRVIGEREGVLQLRDRQAPQDLDLAHVEVGDAGPGGDDAGGRQAPHVVGAAAQGDHPGVAVVGEVEHAFSQNAPKYGSLVSWLETAFCGRTICPLEPDEALRVSGNGAILATRRQRRGNARSTLPESVIHKDA